MLGMLISVGSSEHSQNSMSNLIIKVIDKIIACDKYSFVLSITRMNPILCI